MTQAAFSFTPAGETYLREDFLISEANRAAVAWIERWPDWSSRALIIRGAESSGKTHLAHIWAQISDACFIDADVGKDDLTHLFSPPQKKNTVLDGLEYIKNKKGEEWLFHLLNHTNSEGGFLLITAEKSLSRQSFILPDLYSRLAALPAVELYPPDDELLAALLRKQFSNRQLRVSEDVITWLLPRMERSFAHVKLIAEMIDTAALQNRRAITVPFVRELLSRE